MSTSNQKKGVNLKDFLAKRGSNLLKQEIKKAPEHKKEKGVVKSMPVVVSKSMQIEDKSMQKNKKLGKKKKKKKTIKQPKKEVPSMFKIFDVGKIVDPLKALTFIKWCATAPADREVKTQNELALKLGVDINTLSEWKYRAGFWDEVALYRTQFFRKYTSSYYYALIDRAKKTGDPKAVELAACLFEGYKKKIGFIDETPKELTDKDRELMLNTSERNGRSKKNIEKLDDKLHKIV